MARFSVLMANYNNGAYLDESVRSVLIQTFSDWELIIIDDASTDDSLNRVQGYLGDPRIRLYAKGENEGYTKALIYGLTKVTSGIVGILDSDDALAPDAIEKVYAVHTQRPEVGLVLSQMIVCDSRMRPLLTSTNTPEHLREPLLWMRGCTHFRTFKLSAYAKTAGLDPSLATGQDWDLVFKLEEVAATHRIPEPLYRYRQRSSAAIEARMKYRTRGFVALALYRACLRRRGTVLPNIPRKALLAWLVAAVQCSLELAQPLQAFLFALRSLRIAPFERASWRALGKSICGSMTSFGPRQPVPGVPDESGVTRLRAYPPYSLQSNSGNIEADRIVCLPLMHKEGHCAFGGDYLILEDGRYNAIFELQIDPCPNAQDALAILDVYENLQTRAVLAGRNITSADVAKAPLSFTLEFSAKARQRVEFRVYWAGQCALTLYRIILNQVCEDGLSTPGPSTRTLPQDR